MAIRIFLFLGSLFLFLGSLWGFIKQGVSLYSMGGMFLFGGSCFLIIFEKKWDTYFSKLIKRNRNSFHCQLKNDHFYFPREYYFKHSSLKKSKQLPFSVITEVRANTYPPSVIINSNEVIFLSGLKKEDLQPLKNRFPFTTPQDNWSLICDEFLDTEFSEEFQQMSIHRLAEVNITEEEVAQIRKKLEVRMLFRTSISWEWEYYGQWDVLQELWPLSKKSYWWTMEIALRKK